jgi:hypothetical protein
MTKMYCGGMVFSLSPGRFTAEETGILTATGGRGQETKVTRRSGAVMVAESVTPGHASDAAVGTIRASKEPKGEQMKRRALGALPFVLALAACGDDGGPAAPTANRPPTLNVVQNPAGGAIVGVTTLTFSAAAIDPDGDATTCTWDLGDGTPRTGTTVARSYPTAGTFPVNVTCTDGKGGTVSASGSVAARTLTGTWLPLQNGVPGDRAEITQDGTSLNGYADNSCCRHTFNAEMTAPRAVRFQFRFAGCKKNDTALTGTVSADLNRIELTGTNCNVEQTAFAFVRQ